MKAISRALRHAEQQSPSAHRRRLSHIFRHEDRPTVDFLPPRSGFRQGSAARGPKSFTPFQRPDSALQDLSRGKFGATLDVGIQGRQPLSPLGPRCNEPTDDDGNIIAPAPQRVPASILPSLELPDPALDMEDPHFRPGTLTRRIPCGDVDGAQALNTAGEAGNGTMELINPHSQNSTSSYPRGTIDIVQPSRHSVPSRVLSSPKALLKKLFTSRTHGDHSTIRGPVDAYMALRHRESEFFTFMEKELAKIESFYHFKEKEATERLGVLRAQLHLMRDTRVGELMANKRNAEANTRLNVVSESDVGVSARKWGVPLGNKLGRARSRKTSEAMEQLATPSGPLPMCSYPYEQRDFVRREDLNDVSYRSAKRKLKVALIEFYRGLELLKAYADLNRKAFRKMNKKYDKVTAARPAGHYVSEKVNKAWFVQSEVVENHMVSVEDLYARYFERGNRKVAIRKLRSKTSRTYDYSSNAFRNGLMFSGGVILGVQGLTYAVHLLFHGDPQVRLYTAYLLQVC